MIPELSSLPDFDTLLKNFPRAVSVDVGTYKVTTPKMPVLSVKNITTGLVVVMMDASVKAACVAHVLLPDSNFQQQGTAGAMPPPDASKMPAFFVNQAIPSLWKEMEAKKASPESTKVYIAGGSQLFTFGGGGGNPLNIGARNSIVARAELSKLGLRIDYNDIGGNRPRHLLFSLADDATYIFTRGGETKKI